MAEHEWMKEIRALVGKDYGRVYAWDAVNAAMVRQWCEIMGVDLRTDAAGAVIAPPAMLQVWCMEGPQANHYPPGSTT
ncbi:MAG TPA: DNA-binding protein, partial [Ramlibacter sp.]|nr:DNA-binding protein [Ramlibacter sp.]